MVNSTSKIVYQQLRKDQCCEPHDNCENSQVSVLNKWQQILENFLAFAEPNAHKHDKYQPVLLGGGSYKFVRSEPDAIFKEGKLQ